MKKYLFIVLLILNSSFTLSTVRDDRADEILMEMVMMAVEDCENAKKDIYYSANLARKLMREGSSGKSEKEHARLVPLLEKMQRACLHAGNYQAKIN